MGEFQEADVIWADHSIDDTCRPISSVSSKSPHRSSKHQRKESSPVRIPAERRTWKLDFVRGESNSNEDTFEDDEGEMVPPHVTVARRIAGQMAFSVCTGNGRTLKGRDLSQVRNSVLRMTGFLEG
ncbi:protein S40-1-like [Magnolia sinica]|uniref:protein S40-1-like n=1 Tax=Magnolia sinica TaxID=86752 RepID=UPI00265998AE|nr:protein S40-1-like [Magnolia sinica]